MTAARRATVRHVPDRARRASACRCWCSGGSSTCSSDTGRGRRPRPVEAPRQSTGQGRDLRRDRVERGQRPHEQWWRGRRRQGLSPPGSSELPGGQVWLTLASAWRSWRTASTRSTLPGARSTRRSSPPEGKSGEAGRAYLLFGRVGYVAKGIAVGLVGALFVYAAFTEDPEKSGSTDKALHKVLRAALRTLVADRAVARDRLLRAVPVRARTAPLEVVGRAVRPRAGLGLT